MFLDKDLSMLERIFTFYAEHDQLRGIPGEQISFLLRELKTLDRFLSLQRFAWADETGLIEDLTRIMQSLWKFYYVYILKSPYLDPENGSYEDTLAFLGTVFDLLTEIWKVKLEFRAKYSIPKVPTLPACYNDGYDIPTPKFLMEFVGAVEEDLNVLLRTNDPSLFEVLKELQLLIIFVHFVSKKCIEPQRQHTFFTQVLIVAAHAAAIAWLYLKRHGIGDHELAPNETNALLSDILEMVIHPAVRKIYIDVLQALKSTLQPECRPNIQNKLAADGDSGFEATPADNSVELSTVSNPCQVVDLNQMEVLQDTLSLLRTSLIHLLILDPECHIQDIDTVIVDAGLLIYSLYGIKEKEENPKLEYVNKALGLDLPSNIQPIETMIYLIKRKEFQSNLPRVLGLGYVDFLLNNLKEFQGRYSDSLASIINQLQIIQEELESLQPFLEDIAKEKHNNQGVLQHRATLLIGKAHEVEYVIVTCLRKELPPRCLKLWLSDIIVEVTLISSEVDIEKRKMSNLEPHDTMDTANAQKSPQLEISLRMNDEIIGFEDVREELRDKLVKGCRELDVITIVGMPGLGKTTLASKLYSDPSVISHFDIRAQCYVSQVYKRKELLLAILQNATAENPSSSTGEADVAQKLRRTLLAKRYLILVDDVWEASAWDDLVSCFYDSKNGSRIILTTRHLEVARYATSVSLPIQLRMFNDNESWKLLKDKVFGKDSCPPSLEKVGQQIAKKCGGLPLSVVLVAGILAKMETEEGCWEQVATTTLGSHIHRDSDDIVKQSYQDLPYHLKACFLYFGAFLEDTVIDASLLTRLWISEAFIKSCEGKSVEDIAEGYLENLIGRNLVMVSKRAYLDGKVEACHIHDVLFEFCKKRATEEKFLRLIKWDYKENHSSPIYSRKHHGHSRLAFWDRNNRTFEEWSSSCSLVGSVFWKNFGYPTGFSLSTVLKNFKFLKVLHLEHDGVSVEYFPTNLVHLRYFSTRFIQPSIPSSISNLWNLETLVFDCTVGYLSVPFTILKMGRLRHLQLSGGAFRIENAEEFHKDSSKLHDLVTLTTPFFSCVEEAEMVFGKAPNLRELRCEFARGSSREFSVLDYPAQLEKLHIFPVYMNQMFPVCISSPNLKELRLFGFTVSLQHVSNIAQLQNLQVLLLDSVEFDNKKWKVSNDEFPQLKVLKLDYSTSLEEWTASDDAFPNLERLVLDRCRMLKKIPSCFRDISSLKSIKVRNCKKSVAKSAGDIREAQVEDYQNSDFKLSITGLYLLDDEEEEDDDNNDDDEDDLF